MEALDIILTRRSIRKYKKQTIPQTLIEKLLEAATAAPSAGNQQPWHFIIIDDRKILNQVQTFHPSAKMLSEADKAILVCGDLTLEKFKGYWMIDCAAATENILLAAHAIGLGSCWLGIYPREDRMSGIRKLLPIPVHIIPFSLVSLGYPAEDKPREQRLMSSRIHFNKW